MWAPNLRRAFASKGLASQKQNACHIPVRCLLVFRIRDSATDRFYLFFSPFFSQFILKFYLLDTTEGIR